MMRAGSKAERDLYGDRLLGGLSLLAVHEAEALRAHASAIGERLEMARAARRPGQLISEQVDLLPETRRRLQRDHEVRMQLLRGLLRDLRFPVSTLS